MVSLMKEGLAQDEINDSPRNKTRKRADTTPTKGSSNDDDVKVDIRKSPIRKQINNLDKGMFSSHL